MKPRAMFSPFAVKLLTVLSAAILLHGSAAALIPTRPDPAPRQPSPPPALVDERRMLFAQIVEDEDTSATFMESAIIEGVPYKYMLKHLVGVSHDALRRQSSESLTYDKLVTQPGLYRGQAITLARCVMLEIDQVNAPPEYGLPAGYTILVGVCVDASRDVYAVRIIAPPGSKTYERLHTGITSDALPVIRLCGRFMKMNARRTNDPKEPPWRRPLLVCPEPEFSQAAQPRPFQRELQDANMAHLLPSNRIVEATGAEERMVVEIQPGAELHVRIDGKLSKGADVAAFINEATKTFKLRLPAHHVVDPSAVILKKLGMPKEHTEAVVAALRALGFKRLSIKNEQ